MLIGINLIKLIISLLGVLTVINPTVATLRVFIAASKQKKYSTSYTVSELSVRSGSNGILKKSLYLNGFFSTLMLSFYLLLDGQNLSLSLILSIPLFIFFYLGACNLEPDEGKYRYHTIFSALLIIFLTFLKFALWQTNNDLYSFFFGIVDLVIMLGFFFMKKHILYIELAYAINLSFWVLYIFVFTLWM